MADNNKKRAGSFRKLFPLFFSSKSKEKSNITSQSSLKSDTDSAIFNQYQNPRSVTRTDKYIQGDNNDNTERIYENLAITPHNLIDKMNVIDVSSNHSSSSTLVSESVKNKILSSDATETRNNGLQHLEARPQVPPKPYNEILSSSNYDNNLNSPQYPDVYYHSLEKLTDNISPLDEIEIYKASHLPANPASVGAEIKRVSTKFLISPKKEAEVRTIQPIRARSLSFNTNKEKQNEQDQSNQQQRNKNNIKKPYNYSAPTSPMPVNHRIPSMPKTVSPYEQIRKTMAEAEEKRNSLNRNYNHNKTSNNQSIITESLNTLNSPIHVTGKLDKPRQGDLDKEKTRQRVEAFYWQKLKELKQKEDDFFLKQSLKGSMGQNSSYSVSNCSTPNSLIHEPRSTSLPRGKDLQSYINQPIYSQMQFIRNAPERRTESFIKTRSPYETGVVYRNPEKLNLDSVSSVTFPSRKLPIFQRGSSRKDTLETNQLYKRVSFDEHIPKTFDERSLKASVKPEIPNKSKVTALRYPPRPPVRTTSVGPTGGAVSSLKNNYKMNLHGGSSIYSESESGSEAGEIQRILQSHQQRGTI